MSAAYARAPYDPRFDPLTDPGVGSNRDYAPTYWIAAAGALPADDGPGNSDVLGQRALYLGYHAQDEAR